jgi:hypothetical protein
LRTIRTPPRKRWLLAHKYGEHPIESRASVSYIREFPMKIARATRALKAICGGRAVGG